MEITSQIGSDMAVLELQDAGSPTIMRDDNTSTALYVLMPMRV